MGNYWNPNEDDPLNDDGGGGEDVEEENEFIKLGGRDGVIFLIDAEQNMINDSESFKTALKCVEASMLNRILSNRKDMVGVVYYNTKESPNPPAIVADGTTEQIDAGIVVPKNTAILIPMIELSKEVISTVKSLIGSDDFHDIENRYGSILPSEKNSLAEALWLCSRMIIRCGYKLQQSTIVLFTKIDEPYEMGAPELQQTFVRAKDLRDLGVLFLVVSMNDEFDQNKFYTEFISTIYDIDKDELRIIPGKEQIQYLLQRKFQSDPKRACLRYLKLTICDGFEIGCGIYSFLRKVVKPTPVRLMRDTNELVIAKRTHHIGEINDETLEVEYTRRLMPGEIRKYQEFGGTRITFLPEEISAMKSFQPPGLVLLGFKPQTELPPLYFVKSSKFLYPSERDVKGSTCFFRALLDKCYEHKKFALCVFTLKRKSAPKYVALIPQKADNDGFVIMQLPMQTDIEDMANILDGDRPELPDQALPIMTKIAKRTSFQYKPELFKNPTIKYLYQNLEALVYDEDVDEEIHDSTKPNNDLLDSIIDKYLPEFNEAFGEDPVATAAKRKAKVTPLEGEPLEKVSNDVKGYTAAEITSKLKDDSIKKLTVAELKNHLTELNVNFTSRATKPILISLLEKHYSVGGDSS